MKRTALVLGLLLSISVVAFADEAPPRRNTEPVNTRIQIYVDPDVKEATLEIAPRTLEELVEGGGAVGLASSLSRTQTLFGGLLLSASFIFGGVWLARKKIRSAGAFTAVLFAAAAGTVLVTANVAPPTYQKIDSDMLSDKMKSDKFARGQIKIKVGDDDVAEGIKLVIPMAKKENPNKK
ncbi:MAG: hypothetical protein IPM63_09570 [Acidobacteriota bacterium]|nr:MAG: hypothetical protein IPM63_09570 [Acidobacteriota bacterium]